MFQVFKNAKLEIENQDNYSTYGISDWKAIAKIATVIATLTFIGKALVTQITNDLYKLGAKRFCKSKWPKKYKAIKNVCKDLGYS